MLSQFCIRRPIFATVLSLFIVLSGLIALRVLPLSQYPNITPPSVRVSATYDGADAETIARTVAQPIEDQLSGIEGCFTSPPVSAQAATWPFNASLTSAPIE